MRRTLQNLRSNDPINVTFPNQFPLGKPENEPGKLEIHFEDLLVENLQRTRCRQVKKQKKMERRRHGGGGERTSADHIKDAGNCSSDAETRNCS